MQRTLLPFLQDWLLEEDRKPLVIRGARQVGKTWLVRNLAKISGKQLIEINFEKNPSQASLFNSNDPRQILLNLSTILNRDLEPEHCLLFLDEIQAVPQLFSKLRWFYEDLPELAVVAAGSLLEFVLSDNSFSMPVGRISYMYLEPFSFEEFLLANDKKNLSEYLASFDMNNEIPVAIHGQLLSLFKEYTFIGGLPAVVKSWVNQRSLNKINQLHQDILTTYRDDFVKYRGRINIERLEEVFVGMPKQLGKKFVFSQINPAVQSITIKQILNILEKARIYYRVSSTAANGIPLAAETKEKYFKEVLLDTGLCNAILGLNLNQINEVKEISMINNGGIAEQVVGQLLRTIDAPYMEPHLYCWHREESSSNAEVDYIIQQGNQIIPIEVKSGSTGSLKSLHLFMGLKKFPVALRINSDFPSKINVEIKDHTGNDIKYTLISIPFYLVGQIHRLLKI